jgi:glycosyltransferase involved in cell wall biosynthesis
VQVLVFSADPALSDPMSPASVRHAAYAAALAERRPGARLVVVAPGAPVPDGRFDAVTAQTPLDLRALRVAARRSLPILAQLHFDPFAPENRLRALLARPFVRRAARVRLMTPATAARLSAWGVPAARIWVAPVPIDLPPAPAAARETLVVGAMRLARDRAPLGWVACARAIAERVPNARFVLAGDGPLRARVEAAARGVALDLPGHLPPAALAGLLARGALFLHAAPHEAFGRAMAEAQAAALPVVARRTAGAEAVVRHGETGLLCNSDSDLVTACVALLRDPVRAVAMGAAAQAHAATEFVPAAMRARVVDFLLGERP